MSRLSQGWYYQIKPIKGQDGEKETRGGLAQTFAFAETTPKFYRIELTRRAAQRR